MDKDVKKGFATTRAFSQFPRKLLGIESTKEELQLMKCVVCNSVPALLFVCWTDGWFQSPW